MSKKLFVVSDTHFFHENIVKYARTQFKDVEDMHEHIIKQWNSVVKEEDLVLHLGDVMNLMEPQAYEAFSDKIEAFENNTIKLKSIMDKLNGRIVLLPGNHDVKHLEYKRHFFNHAGFNSTEQNTEQIVIGKYIFTHVPMGVIPEGYINVHGHVHVGGSQELYAMDERRMNVNVEQTGYKPVLLEMKQSFNMTRPNKSRGLMCHLEKY